MIPDLVIVIQTWPEAFLGGTERQAFQLAERLADRGFTLEVWTRAAERLLRPRRVAIRPMATSSFFFALDVARAARKRPPPRIFAPLISSHTWALSRSYSAGRLVVKVGCGGEHGDVAVSRRRPWGDRKLNDVFRRADCLAVPDDSIVPELVDAGCPRAKIAVVPNGVDLERFSSGPPLMDRPMLALFVGRLTHQKSAERLPELWSGAPPGARLRIVGDGPARAGLERWARDRSDVEFVGAESSVERHYREARVILHPSRSEGLSNVILESLSCGTPVLASDIPSSRRVIEAVSGGRALSLGDTNAWRSAVSSMLLDPLPVSRADLEAYSLDSMTSRYQALFEL